MIRNKTGTACIEIKDELRASMQALLNRQLADTLDLYTQVKQAHWNVKGARHLARLRQGAAVPRGTSWLTSRRSSIGGESDSSNPLVLPSHRQKVSHLLALRLPGTRPHGRQRQQVGQIRVG